MKRCKTCKYYKPIKIGIVKWFNVNDTKKEEPFYKESNSGKKHIVPFGECKSIKFEYGEGYWVDMKNGKIKSLNDDSLYYIDSEEYGASFRVGENFGCIHWKKND